MSVDRRPLESECTTTIIAAARMLGYRVHHSRPARTRHGWATAIQGDAGLPDLLIAGHGRCFMVELKRRENRATGQQMAWIDTLAAAGINACVVIVPDEQQAFIDRLTRYASRRSS